MQGECDCCPMKNQNGSNPLAYIVEDDRSLAEAYAASLSIAEYDTKIMHTGSAFQAAVVSLDESHTPALIILDLHLPDADGEVLLQQIRADTRLSATHVIIATADNRRATLIDSADLVLLKPVGFLDLKAMADRFRP